MHTTTPTHHSALTLAMAALTSAIIMSCNNTSTQETTPTPAIDTLTQQVCRDALIYGLQQLPGCYAQAIVMECPTGNIRAMVEVSDKGEGNYEETHLFDYRGPSGFMPFASTLLCLDTGSVRPDDIIDTGCGMAVIKGDTIKDPSWSRGGFRNLNASQSLTLHSEIFTSLMVDKVFGDDSARYCEKLKEIGYGLPETFDTLDVCTIFQTPLPNSALSCLGYSNDISPIQTLTFFNAIVNDGRMVLPTLTEVQTPTVMKEKILKPQTIAFAKEVMTSRILEACSTPTDTIKIAGYKAMPRYVSDDCGSCQYFAFFPIDKPKYTILLTLNHHTPRLPKATSITDTVVKHIVERTNLR